MSATAREIRDETGNTETRILEAAKHVFTQKGIEVASMQEIADLAGISRTALHYYFRNKKHLADAVLDDLFSQFIPKVEEILYDGCTFCEKMERLVDVYLDMFIENPYFPNFIMNEINRKPEEGIRRLRQEGLMSPGLLKQVESDLHGFDSPMDVAQFMMNLISLCVFPFIARPVVEAFLMDDHDGDAFKRFVESRKPIIVRMMLTSEPFVSAGAGKCQ